MLFAWILGHIAHSDLKMKAALAILISSLISCNNSDFQGRTPKLPAIKPLTTKEFVQLERPTSSQSFKQGKEGLNKAENFAQGEWGALDLLVVIDNSGSMAEEQLNLGSKLESLLSHVSQSDWQIGVVTTDPADGCLKSLVKKGEVDAQSKFNSAIKAGTSGTGTEQGIRMAVEGLKGNCLPQSWVRPKSSVAVLIVSDEDNCHITLEQGYGCANQPFRSESYLMDYLKTIRTPGQDARVYGIIWHPSTSSSECATAPKQGFSYANIIDETKGKWGSICDADYTNTLKAISEDVSKILKMDYDLAETPDEGSLAVLVDGFEFKEFKVEGKKVTFTTPPPFGSKVEFKYRVGKSGENLSELALKEAPYIPSLKVKVNGQELASDKFEYLADKKSILLKEKIAEEAEIIVEQKNAITLQEDFEIGSKVDPSTLKVLVNDQEFSGYQFLPDQGILKISPPLDEKTSLKVTFKER